MTATTEPARVTAGDTIQWAKSLPNYLAGDGWVLSYTLINPTTKISITSAGVGDDHQVSVSASASAVWVAGSYAWVSAVTRGAERFTLGQGTLQVLPNLAAATVFDGRSSVRKALESVNLALETYGNKAYLHSYEINGRKQAFHTPGEFLAFRSKLMAEVAAEDKAARLAAGFSPRNLIKVRFNAR